MLRNDLHLQSMHGGGMIPLWSISIVSFAEVSFGKGLIQGNNSSLHLVLTNKVSGLVYTTGTESTAVGV